jgi:hypothetical protein
MIEEAKNLATLVAIVKKLKFKSVSELTTLEAHAAAFFCNTYPLAFIDNKLKYDKTSKQVGLSISYIWANKLIKTLNPVDTKGFTANSVHIFEDQPLPHFPTASVKEALLAYPNQLLIPMHQLTEYESLPRIQKSKPEPSKKLLASILLEVYLHCKYPENTPNYIKFILNEIHLKQDDFKDLLTKFPDLPCLKDISLEGTDQLFTRTTYKEEHNLNISPLATIIIWARQGIFICIK